MPAPASDLRQLLEQSAAANFSCNTADLEAALAAGDWADEAQIPDVGARMLGLAIDLWLKNRTRPIMEQAVQALLAADARADRTVELPSHIVFSTSSHAPSHCMPLEWFLAGHHPNPHLYDALPAPPEALTRKLFAGVDLIEPAIATAVDRFLASANPGQQLPAGTQWLARALAQARLQATLPASVTAPPPPRM